MYHFFVTPSNISGEQAVIEGSDVNHIRNVLRMRVGEQLLLSDGQGQDYVCRISSLSDNCVICDIESRESSGTEPGARFYLFQGLAKADKMEHVIQKGVELGVYEVIPVQTHRSVVKYDEKKKDSKTERWQKIAESAAKQSRRGIIPEVKAPMTFKEALEYARSLDMNLIPYENFKDVKASKEILGKIKKGMSVGIFVGPEGGFEEAEVDAAREMGAEAISLGNRILRTETAPLMLLSVLGFMLEE